MIDSGTPAGGNKRLSLPKLEEFSSALRTMFINIGFFAALLLLVPAVGGQFTRNAVVIEPIAVPSALSDRGLTSEVVANRLWDGLQDFAESASAARETVAAIPDSQLIEFSLPDSGISVDSIFTQVRQFFGAYDTRIGGEFLCATPACEPAGLRLRLRIVSAGSDIVDLSDMGGTSEQDYYREAAAGIFAIIDPYVAIAAQAQSAPVRAATLARRLVAENSRDAKWAHNLIGDIERRGGKPEQAIAAYQAALAIDPAFHVARAGLARAFIDGGDIDAAEAALAEIERQAPDNRLAPSILADIALHRGDPVAAIEHLIAAAARDPLNPEYLTRAGEIALAGGDAPDAVSHLTEALSIEPAYGPALALLAAAEEQAGDASAAEAAYRDWLENEPGSARAHAGLGRLYLDQRRFADALASLERALAKMPGDAEVRRDTAAALLGLGRYDQALEALALLLEQGPADAETLLLVGQAHQFAGHPADALVAYRRALDLQPDGPAAAAAREAVRLLENLLAATGS